MALEELKERARIKKAILELARSVENGEWRDLQIRINQILYPEWNFQKNDKEFVPNPKMPHGQRGL